MDVAVNDVVRAPVSHHATKIGSIDPGHMRMQAGDDIRAERKDLVVVGTGSVCVNEEVHLKSVPVNMTKHMKQPCLDTSSPHATYNVEDSNRSGRLLLYVH
jgi:hypothetical protein